MAYHFDNWHRGNPLKHVGTKVLIMTVTQYFTGEIVSVDVNEAGFPQMLCLAKATWIADTGRLSECLANGTVKEAEYCGEGIVTVMLGAGVAVFHWPHALPVATT